MKKIFLWFIMLVFCLSFVEAGYISQYPPIQSETYVRATNYNIPSRPYQTTTPTNSLIDDYTYTQWMTGTAVITNQRFHIDLGSAKIIKRIYYENSHGSGSMTDSGAKTFTFWGSNISGSFSELTYAIDTGWTQIAVDKTTLDQHIASNVADPKYVMIIDNVSFRYYAFKFADNWGYTGRMGVRRIELQEVECSINEDCDLCEKCIDTSCVNQSGIEDLKNECEISFDNCLNNYIRQGGDGYCDGSGFCDVDDTLLNVTAGNVCDNGSDVNPTSEINCGNWSDCVLDNCFANEYYVGYIGNGTDICIDTDWQSTETTYNVPDNYIVSATNKQNECDLTNTGKSASYNVCLNNYIRQGSDGYCDGSGSLDTDDAFLNVSEGNVCYESNDINPDNITNCDIWINCIKKEIDADKYYVGYKGDGTNICSIIDWIDTIEDWYAPTGQRISETSIEIESCAYEKAPEEFNMEGKIILLITILLVFSTSLFLFNKFGKKGMSKIGKSKIGVYLIIFFAFMTKVLAVEYDYARENMLLNIVTIFLIIGLIYFIYFKFFKEK